MSEIQKHVGDYYVYDSQTRQWINACNSSTFSANLSVWKPFTSQTSSSGWNQSKLLKFDIADSKKSNPIWKPLQSDQVDKNDY